MLIRREFFSAQERSQNQCSLNLCQVDKYILIEEFNVKEDIQMTDENIITIHNIHTNSNDECSIDTSSFLPKRINKKKTQREGEI